MLEDALKIGDKMKIGWQTWTISGLHTVLFDHGLPKTVVLLERKTRYKTIILRGQWVYGSEKRIDHVS